MAVLRSDIIIPEIFTPYVIEQTTQRDAFLASGVVQPMAELNATEGGDFVKVPFFSANLSGDLEVLSDSSSLTPGKISTDQQIGVVLHRGRAFESRDLAALASGADPMAAIGQKIGAYIANQRQKDLFSCLSGVFGSINANDINLALTTNSFVIGFNVRADSAAKKLAEKESIDVLYYGIIYDLIDGIKVAIEGHLKPDVKEEILGTAEVKDLFKSPKFGLIAGSIVIEGTIKRNKPIRVLRDDIVIFEGELDSLKRFKDDANEVPMGTECGIGVSNYKDVQVGDKIEVFDRVEVKRTLD